MLPLELQEINAFEGVFFYRQGQLAFRLGSDRVELTSTPPSDKASVRVAGLKIWPFLSFKDGQTLTSATVSTSERAVYFVGAATLFSTVGLVAVAIWMGRRQFQRARARTDLAASVAHELRTTLAGQRIVLESMLDKKKFDENYLQMALRENKRLGDLSEEFLTFSRLERGVLDLQLEPLDLEAGVQEAVSRFSNQFDDVELSISGSCQSKVLADAAAISTILENLLENAWKYSEEPRRIEIVLIEEGEEVGFEVKDNGIGLSAGDQKKIFRQFFRVEKALSRSQDGLGIGLSIVRRLVEAMNGKIEVKSEKGRGSAFRVILRKGGLK
jgi:signal transduction histidine kinase